MSAATAAKPLPTAEQLKTYYDQLPEIYRGILVAFALADPNRRYGHSLAFSTIFNHLRNARYGFVADEVEGALNRLCMEGFCKLESSEFLSYSPTEVGEELIAVVTGRRAAKLNIPDLPKPTW